MIDVANVDEASMELGVALGMATAAIFAQDITTDGTFWPKLQQIVTEDISQQTGLAAEDASLLLAPIVAEVTNKLKQRQQDREQS